MPFDAFQQVTLDDEQRVIAAITKWIAGDRPAPRDGTDPQPLLVTKRTTLPGNHAQTTPSRLLVASNQMVDFEDFTGVKQQLRAWALDPTQRLAGRVIHGAGGVGKTRLAIELMEQLEAEDRWLTGFISQEVFAVDRRRLQLQRLISQGRDVRGLCLAMDYAEGKDEAVKQVCSWLCERDVTALGPARLLLLSREAGEWWERLADDDMVHTVFFGGGPAELDFGARTRQALTADAGEDGAQQAVALYKAARAAFATTLGKPEPQDPLPPQLGERPLEIAMRALLAVLGVTAGGDLSQVLRAMLKAERQYWADTAGAARGDGQVVPVNLIDLERAATLVTLVGGVSDRGDLARMLVADAYAGARTPAQVDALIHWLTQLYPGAEGALVAPVEPDLLGEHLVADVAGGEPQQRLIPLALEGDDRDRRRMVLTVLDRATRAEHGGRGDKAAAALKTLLQDRLEAPDWREDVLTVSLEGPGRLPDLVAELVRAGAVDGVVEALRDAMPEQTVRLMDLALAVQQALVRLHPRPSEPWDDPVPEAVIAEAARAAHELDGLGNRLSWAGQREAALAATQEAVDLYRGLAAQRPDAFTPDLARSLSNLSDHLDAVDRTPEAAAASEEALRLLEPVVQQYPEPFRGLTTVTLNDYKHRSDKAGLPVDQALVARLRAALSRA